MQPDRLFALLFDGGPRFGRRRPAPQRDGAQQRGRRGLVPALQALCALLLVLPACDPEPPAAGAVAPGSVARSGPRPADPLPGAAGWSCEVGPAECDWSLGCVDGTCGRCSDSSQCRPMEACGLDGFCGSCSVDAECRQGEVCSQGFCLAPELPVWDLEIAEDDYEAMLLDVWEELYVPASLRVGGQVYPGAQVRLHGGSTRPYPKHSFRVVYPEDAPHPGYSRKITLRAEYNDPSFVRSFVGYETFRRLTRLPTPLARYVRLRVNGEDYGVMLEVERISGKFLERNGRDRDRPLYEAANDDPRGALMPMPGPKDYADVWDQKSGARDFADLVGLIEEGLHQDLLDSEGRVSTSTARMRRLMDVEGYLDYLAVMVLLQNRDHITNNFYLSLQELPGKGERWEVYPFDLDLTLGCGWTAEHSTICHGFEADDWVLNGVIVEEDTPGCWCNLGIHLALNDPDLFAGFRDRVCRWSRGEWWSGRGSELVDALHTTYAGEFLSDPNDRNTNRGSMEAARRSVQAFFDARTRSVREQLGCDPRGLE